MLHLPDVVPGMIAAIQTFGQLLHWNPHIHSLVTCGASTPEGEFLHLPEFDVDRLLLAWQEAVFSLYLSERKIEPEVNRNFQILSPLDFLAPPPPQTGHAAPTIALLWCPAQGLALDSWAPTEGWSRLVLEQVAWGAEQGASRRIRRAIE